MKLRLALCSLTISLLIGCGTPGAPQPPSLHLPKAVTDLKAVRKGDKVYLSWAAPAETTDGEGIRSEGTVLVCRALQTPSAANCRDKAGQVPLLPTNATPNRRQTFVDDVGPAIAANDPRDFFTYNVIAANNRSKSAGPSNPVAVFLAPSVRPVRLNANVEHDGVRLYTSILPLPPISRFNAKYLCQFQKYLEGTAPTIVGEEFDLAPVGRPGETGFVDHSAEVIDRNTVWEKPQTYTFFCKTKVLSHDGSKTLYEFEGESAAPLAVTPHDVFPPAAPQAVQAVYSSGFIDLSWHSNTESDIAGYNVYRSWSWHERKGGVGKLNAQPITASAFRDDKLEGLPPDTEIWYTVTAVDTQGNESAQSKSATERIPR